MAKWGLTECALHDPYRVYTMLVCCLIATSAGFKNHCRINSFIQVRMVHKCYIPDVNNTFCEEVIWWSLFRPYGLTCHSTGKWIQSSWSSHGKEDKDNYSCHSITANNKLTNLQTKTDKTATADTDHMTGSLDKKCGEKLKSVDSFWYLDTKRVTNCPVNITSWW